MPEARPTRPAVVSPNEAARILGLSRATLYRHMKAGRISALKSGGRTLIRLDTIDAYLAALPAWTGIGGDVGEASARPFQIGGSQPQGSR